MLSWDEKFPRGCHLQLKRTHSVILIDFFCLFIKGRFYALFKSGWYLYIGKIFIPICKGLIWVSNQILCLPNICPAIAEVRDCVWSHHIWHRDKPPHEAYLSMGSHLNAWRREWVTRVSHVSCARAHSLHKDPCHLILLLQLSHRQFPSYPDVKGKHSFLISRKKDDAEMPMSSAERQSAALYYKAQEELFCFIFMRK